MRILIAEDDVVSRSMLQVTLTRWGHEVVSAENGAQAWAEMRREDAPMLAILDWMMPEMDGLEVCRRIRSLHQDNPPYVIILSGKSEKADIIQGLEIGANDYLTKPVDFGELHARIEVGSRMLELQAELVRKIRESWESKQLLERTFAALDDAIFVIDAKTLEIIDCNPTASGIFGYGRRRMLGKTPAFLHVDQASFDAFKQYLGRAKHGKEALPPEFRMKRGDGVIVPTEHNVTPLTDECGQRIGWVNLVRDVSVRKEAEQELRQSRADLLRAQKAARIGSWKYHIRKNVFSGSREFARIFELQQDAPMGYEALARMIHSEDRDMADKTWKEAVRAGRPFEVEHRIVCGETIKWVRTVGESQTEGVDQEKMVIGITQDITEKKQSEIKEKTQQEQLLQAAKMAALGTLVAGVAHEVNNPNNFIMLNAPLLEKVWSDALPVLEKHHALYPDFALTGIPFEQMRGYVTELFSGLHEGSKRIKHIVAELKYFARQTPLNMNQEVQLNEVVQAALTMLRKTIAQHTAHFQVSLDPLLPLVQGDFQKLEQVVVNLLINACQALPDKSRGVLLETFSVPSDDAVVLRIIDEGEGIPQENLGRILDPFFSTRQDIGGTGLGLAISAAVIREHAGRMAFDSVPGRGTTVTVSLKALA
jgi:PAS domain S-box-containing protein